MSHSFFRSSLSLATLGLALPLVIAACGDSGSDSPDAGSTPTFDASVEVDANTDKAVTLNFAAVVGDAAFACSDGSDAKTYDNVGTAGSTVFFKDFRFYVSNIRLINAAGAEVPMTLETDGIWQLQTDNDGHVALLDFEDGSANCSDFGNADTNSVVQGTVPEGSYTGVVFDLGVPFGLNHLDVATAQAPLNISGLYWAWSIGHKFARIDYSVDQGPSWNFHLGSIRCQSDGQTSPPTEECGRPNRPIIRLENFSFETDTIELDALAIVADSDLTVNAGNTPGCMSFPDDEDDCVPLFPNLGIEYATGVCINDCADQSVFSVVK